MAIFRFYVVLLLVFVTYGDFQLVAAEEGRDTALSIVDIQEQISDNDGKVTDENTANVDGGLAENVFVPTKEWRRVEQGQAIPAGLHVRMNIQTGEKEAKLMDENGNVKSWKMEDGKEGVINADGKKSFTKAQLKEALKKLEAGAEDEQQSSQGENLAQKFRSYDELKEELAQLRLQVKSDLEILNEVMTELKQKNITDERKLIILQDIEYLVHQVDNAQNFVDMGGFTILSQLLNSTDPQFRQWAAFIVGSATQSNPKVKVAAFENGLLHHLVRSFQNEQVDNVRRKYLFAISAILRQFPFAQRKFLDLGGLEALRNVLQQSTTEETQRLKIVTLISDLLQERHEIEDTMARYTSSSPIHHQTDLLTRLQQYRDAPLIKSLVDGGWCRSIGDLLSTPNMDSQEKVLQAMNTMITECKAEFAVFSNRLRQLEEQYRSLLAEDSDNEFLVNLISLAKDVRMKFIGKDEL